MFASCGFLREATIPTSCGFLGEATRVGLRAGVCAKYSSTERSSQKSYEFWHALKTLGVENQFVVYEGEGHFIYKPADQRDIMSRLLSWFNQHLGVSAD